MWIPPEAVIQWESNSKVIPHILHHSIIESYSWIFIQNETFPLICRTMENHHARENIHDFSMANFQVRKL